MSKVLWLDDIRDPVKFGFLGADWVYNAQDAIDALMYGNYTFASLDHDLSIQATIGTASEKELKEETGYTVILFLEEHPEYWPSEGVRVHSANPVGKQKMETVIKRHYGRNFK